MSARDDSADAPFVDEQVLHGPAGDHLDFGMRLECAHEGLEDWNSAGPWIGTSPIGSGFAVELMAGHEGGRFRGERESECFQPVNSVGRFTGGGVDETGRPPSAGKAFDIRAMLRCGILDPVCPLKAGPRCREVTG